MTAYWIGIYRQIDDEAELAADTTLAGPALEAAGAAHDMRIVPGVQLRS